MSDGFELTVANGAEAILSNENRLVDLIDGLLDKGVVIRGEAWLSVADIDLVFLGVDLVLASHDRMKR